MNWIQRRIGFSRDHGQLQPNRSLVQSFNYAIEGIIHVLATQRNMRIHFTATAFALALCVFFGVERVEFSLVLLAACFVILAEMLNTAIESAVDVATRDYHPLAKIAKDVAAGAVFVAAGNAIVVGYLVFGWRLGDPSRAMLLAIRDAPVHLAVIILVLTFLATIALKAVSRRDGGTALRGGWPSGHAAVAFAVWMTVTMVTLGFAYDALVSVLALLLALLVVHTRVEAGVHTVGEVFAGAVLGSVVALVVFQSVTRLL